MHVWRESVHDGHRGNIFKCGVVRHTVLGMLKAGRNWKILLRAMNEPNVSNGDMANLCKARSKNAAMFTMENRVLLVQHDEGNFFIQDLSETTIIPGLLALFRIILVLLTLITISFRSTLR